MWAESTDRDGAIVISRMQAYQAAMTLRKTYFFIAVCGAFCGAGSAGLAAFCRRFVSVTPEGLRITILERPSRPPGRKIILCAGSYAMLYPFTSVGSSWSTT